MGNQEELGRSGTPIVRSGWLVCGFLMKVRNKGGYHALRREQDSVHASPRQRRCRAGPGAGQAAARCRATFCRQAQVELAAAERQGDGEVEHQFAGWRYQSPECRTGRLCGTAAWRSATGVPLRAPAGRAAGIANAGRSSSTRALGSVRWLRRRRRLPAEGSPSAASNPGPSGGPCLACRAVDPAGAFERTVRRSMKSGGAQQRLAPSVPASCSADACRAPVPVGDCARLRSWWRCRQWSVSERAVGGWRRAR